MLRISCSLYNSGIVCPRTRHPLEAGRSRLCLLSRTKPTHSIAQWSGLQVPTTISDMPVNSRISGDQIISNTSTSCNQRTYRFSQFQSPNRQYWLARLSLRRHEAGHWPAGDDVPFLNNMLRWMVLKREILGLEWSIKILWSGIKLKKSKGSILLVTFLLSNWKSET